MRNALLIFARTPIIGKVKNRLIPTLGVQATTELYIALAEYTFSQCEKTTRFQQIQLWQTEEAGQWEARYPFKCLTQPEGNLGKRMYCAFQQTLAQFDSAVLIGVDCPSLSSKDLDHAAQQLNDNNVIGPSEDGGYYLLGLNECHQGLFEGVHWGHGDVAKTTYKNAKKCALKFITLEKKWDIDRIEDVQRLLNEHADFLQRKKSLHATLRQKLLSST